MLSHELVIREPYAWLSQWLSRSQWLIYRYLNAEFHLAKQIRKLKRAFNSSHYTQVPSSLNSLA